MKDLVSQFKENEKNFRAGLNIHDHAINLDPERRKRLKGSKDKKYARILRNDR